MSYAANSPAIIPGRQMLMFDTHALIRRLENGGESVQMNLKCGGNHIELFYFCNAIAGQCLWGPCKKNSPKIQKDFGSGWVGQVSNWK